MRENDAALVAGVFGLFFFVAVLMVVFPSAWEAAFLALAVTVAAVVLMIRRGR